MTPTRIATASGTALALLLTAGTAGAQYTLTGDGCPGESGIVPSIAGKDFPTVGQTYSIEVSGPGNTAVLALYGLIPISPKFDISAFGLPGCALGVVGEGSALGTTNDDGVVNFPAPAPAIAGITLYVQAYVADSGLTTLGGVTEVLSFTTLPPSAFSGGEVITTEFMRDPSGIVDGDGEWIEVHNTTGSPIDIEGWYLADDDTDFHEIDTGGSGLIVPAGGYAVLGANADAGVSGVSMDYEWSGFFLSNSTSSGGDEIRLLDPVGFEVDRLKYSVPDGWPLQGGASTALDPSALDGVSNDDPANWCLDTTNVYEIVVGTNTGTPGVVNPDCPEKKEVEIGDIIVTEFMPNPAAISDTDGEYFEVYNTTEGAIDIEGWTISDLGSDSHTIDNGGSGVIVPGGGYAVLARSGSATTATIDYVYAGFFLANASDEIVLRDASNALQDEVIYDDESWIIASGLSTILFPSVSQDAITNNDPFNWCISSSALVGTGDFGTPGTANDPCTKK